MLYRLPESERVCSGICIVYLLIFLKESNFCLIFSFSIHSSYQSLFLQIIIYLKECQSLNVRFFTSSLVGIKLKEIYHRISRNTRENIPIIRRIIEAHTELIQWGMDEQKMISEKATNRGYVFLRNSDILHLILGL